MIRYRHKPPRRRVALLGVLAVLFQAILFGWHHHPIAFAARGQQPVAAVANAAVPSSPADVEDACEICAALHHLSASPGEFVSLPLPPIAATAAHPPEIVRPGSRPDRGFHARAPPRTQAIPV